MANPRRKKPASSGKEPEKTSQSKVAVGSVGESDGEQSDGGALLNIELESAIFSGPAVLVLSTAQSEADSMGSYRVGTEHLLLGLVHDPESMMHRALTNRGISVNELRNKVAQISASEWTDEQAGEVKPKRYERFGSSENLGQVIQSSLSIASSDKAKVRPEHLWISLSRCTAGGAERVLRSLDWSLSDMSEAVAQELIISSRPPAQTERKSEDAHLAAQPTVLEYLDSSSLSVIRLACGEAQAMGLDEVPVQCLLLGLLALGESKAFVALTSFGFALTSLRISVRKQLGVAETGRQAPTKGKKGSGGLQLPLSVVFKKVLDMAFLQAKQYGNEKIAPGHLLLGLFVLAEGHFLELLSERQIDGAAVRRKILELMNVYERSYGMGESLFTSSAATPEAGYTPASSMIEDRWQSETNLQSLDTTQSPVELPAIGVVDWERAEIPLSFTLISLILLAESQCYGLGLPELNCESLLLSLLLMRETFAARALLVMGLSIAKIEEKLLRPTGVTGPVMFSRGAEALIDAARELARDLNSDEVKVEHLLLEMLTEDDQELRRVQEFLKDIKIDTPRVRKQLFEYITYGDDALPVVAETVSQEEGQREFELLLGGQRTACSEVLVRLSPAARRVLMLAAREALWWGRNFIDAEHLLIGIYLGEGGGNRRAAELREKLGTICSRVPGLLISPLAMTEAVLDILREAADYVGTTDIGPSALKQALEKLRPGLVGELFSDERINVSSTSLVEPEYRRATEEEFEQGFEELESCEDDLGVYNAGDFKQDEFFGDDAPDYESEEEAAEKVFSITKYPFNPDVKHALGQARVLAGNEPRLIEPVHVFQALGFLCETVDLLEVAADSFSRLSISVAGRGRGVAGFSNDTLRLFNLALDLMEVNVQKEIAVIHLLTALCRAEDRAVSSCFTQLGLDSEAVRRKLMARIEAG